jgi:hypothetical protein
MIINHANQVGVMLSMASNKIKQWWHTTEIINPTSAAIVAMCILGGALLFVGVNSIVQKRNAEISEIKYELLQNELVRHGCPIADELKAAFDSDGYISEVEYSKMRDKCTAIAVVKQKSKVRNALKEIITTTGEEKI